jgi:hypothetical protein
MVFALSACGGLGSTLATATTASQSRSVAPASVTWSQSLSAAQGLSGAIPVQRPRPMHARPAVSWMLPEAKSEELLYVSDYYDNVVDVYSYPKLKPVGVLTTDMLSPDGLCTDAKGDVFVVNNTPNIDDVLEFAHGGTTPIQTLQNPGQIGVACSVDPVTGNLAVTNIEALYGGQGSISIYAGATGYPAMYFDSDMYAVYYCTYDGKGNLYMDGFSGGVSNGSFEFAEMPKGKTTFTPITLQNTTINFTGNLLWDGKYVDVEDQEAMQDGSVLTSKVYRTTGADGKVVSSATLEGSDDVSSFIVEGKDLIGTNFYGDTTGFWAYPKSKKELKTIGGFSGAIGIALSK